MMTILGVIGHILLILLKILLILLAVILLLVLIVLILPIRYEAAARGDSRTGLPSVYVQARVNVILGLISLRIMLKEGALVYALKVLRFSLKKGRKQLYGEMAEEEDNAGETSTAAIPQEVMTEPKAVSEKPEASPETSGDSAKEEKPEEPKASAETAGGSSKAEKPETPKPSPETSGSSAKAKKKDKKADAPVEAPADGTEADSGKKEKTPWRPRPIMEMILDLTDAIGDLRNGKIPGGNAGADGMTDRLQSVSDKIFAAEDKAAFVMEQAQDPSVIRTVQRVKRALFRILRAYLPREIRMEGEFGTGDPASTGQALGWIYTFYPLYCEKGDIRVAGNFEETMVKGKIYLKGHIRLIVAVGSAILLLPDRNIRKLIKKLLFGGDKHGTE